MINKYIDRHGTDQEKILYNDLAEEYIKFAGWDVVYVQRDNFSEDQLLGRADGDYTNSRVVEMTIESESAIDLFNNSTASKFGLVDNPTANFSMMKRRFEAEFDPETKPMPGDIIFLQHKSSNPVFDAIFEIRKVEMINPTQFGGYVEMYLVYATHWNMKGEEVKTGRPTIDAHNEDFTRTNDTLANENSIIQELLQGIVAPNKETGATDIVGGVINDPKQFDPFSHTF